MFRQHLLSFSLYPLTLVLSLGTTEKSLAPSSLHSPFRYLHKLVRYPLKPFLQAKQSQVSQPFLVGDALLCITFMTLHWTLSSMSIISLVSGSPKPDTILHVQPHQCRTDREKGSLSTLLLMQLRTPLATFATKAHHWLVFNFGVHQDPLVLSCQATFQLVSPQHVQMHGVLPPQVQDFALLLAESSAHFSSMSRLYFLYS